VGARDDLITPPQPPPVRRLNRGVWIAAMVLVGGTLLAIVFLAAPRGAGRRAGAPSPAPPLAGGDPGFLSRPPGELPAAAPSVSEQEYLRGLLARQGRTGGVGEGAGGAGVGGGEGAAGMAGAGLGVGSAEGGGIGAGGTGAGAGAGARSGGAAAGSGAPRDPRREAFLRALQAPLARSAAPAGRVGGRGGLGGAWNGGGGGEPGWTGGEEGDGGEVAGGPGRVGGEEGLPVGGGVVGAGGVNGQGGAAAMGTDGWGGGRTAAPVPPPPGTGGASAKEGGATQPRPGWPGGEAAPQGGAGTSGAGGWQGAAGVAGIPGAGSAAGWGPAGAGWGVPAAGAPVRGWEAQGGVAGGAEESGPDGGAGGSGGGTAGRGRPGAVASAVGEGRFGAFSAAAGRLRGRTDLPVRYHPAPGPTTLPAGSLIPALLLTEVNSDLPGNLLAQVSRNVYDGRQERVLVPQGSRLLGRYDSQVAVGQRRLLVAWTRLVLPDGSSYELPGLPGTTAAGAAGLGGRVNNHVLQVFGDALLLSLLSAGAELSQPRQGSFTAVPSTGAVAAAALGQELSSVGLQLLARGMAIQPTLRLPAATRFLVFVNGDLDLGRGTAGGEGRFEQR
jgi:hypothetical protein